MKVAASVLVFLARHLLFNLLAMIVGCVVWIFVYLALLVVAVVSDQGVGGPLAFPVGLMFVVSTSCGLGLGLFAPASAVGAFFCGLFRLPRLAAIPVVFLAALVMMFLASWLFAEMSERQDVPSLWLLLKNFLVYLSVPLGAYWWLTEGPGAIFDTFCRWFRRWRG